MKDTVAVSLIEKGGSMGKDQFYYKKCMKYYQKLLEGSFIVILIVVIGIFYSFQTFPGKYVYEAREKASSDTIKVVTVTSTAQNRERPQIEIPDIPLELGELDAIEDEVSIKMEELTNKKAEFVFAGIVGPPDLGPPEIDFEVVQEKPKLIRSVKPVYPYLAKKAGIEGKVVLKVLIDTNGNIERYEFLEKHALFVEAVTKVIKKLKYTPGKQRDKEVKVWMKLPFEFTLNN